MSKRDTENILKWRLALVVSGSLVVIILVLALMLNLVYRGKIFFNVRANGVDVGGQTKDQALASINKKTESYMQKPIVLAKTDDNWQIYPAQIDLSYQNQQIIDDVYDQTNSTNIFSSLINEFAIIFGIKNNFTSFSYNKGLLAERILPAYKTLSSPVNDASFMLDNEELRINPEKPGVRIDLEKLIYEMENNLAKTNSQIINIPTYDLPPAISKQDLAKLSPQVQDYIDKPLILTYGTSTYSPNKKTIVSWVKVGSNTKSDIERRDLLSLFAKKSLSFSSSLNPEAISNYLISFSDQIDQKAKDASLVFSGGLKVTSPSKDGRELNINSSTEKIIQSLSQKTENDKRLVALSVDIKRPDVREDNLASLGINELISEGVTYFPGSPPNRLINVRIGASRFNGVLLKPNEVFSFGELLGPVGPEQGYTLGLVILEDHEEKQYGGGMCQVSSTAFRAALLAGLPILERHSHAFAVSYYTAPFGVPGVDATIYYPPVDLKFKNDTGAYLLIQTNMVGTTLKFDFYGTKTKSGEIRGPEFISGSNDANQPSHTVFYRDILSGGKVVKTDTFHTYYRPATDFPITDD